MARTDLPIRVKHQFRQGKCWVCGKLQGKSRTCHYLALPEAAKHYKPFYPLRHP